MADPYAARTRTAPTVDQPAPAGAFEELVASLDGVCARTGAELSAAVSSSPRFVAIPRSDEGLLPAFARLELAQAYAIVLGDGEIAGSIPASDTPLFLLKHGRVGGCEEGEVGEELAASLLRAALDGALDWEVDPDFGYEVVAGGEGVGQATLPLLCPRLLYSDQDRVYEHAELVVDYKRTRGERAAQISGLDRAVVAATGWPIEPTGQSWKED